MITLEPPTALSPTEFAHHQTDELLDLQLSVARRADALAHRLHLTARDTDRRVWLRAEFEVFERSERNVIISESETREALGSHRCFR